MKLYGIFAATLIAGAIISQPVQAASPSFDCSYADKAAERAICDSWWLARMDRRLAYWYRKAMERAYYFDFEDELRADQRSWLYSRNSCGYNRRCLRRAYRERIRYLRNYATHV